MQIIKAWQCISPEVTMQSFKKCCISTAVNETDDDILWNGSEDGSCILEHVYQETASPFVQNFGCHLIFTSFFFFLFFLFHLSNGLDYPKTRRQQTHLKCCYLNTYLHSSTSLIIKTFISTAVHIKSGRVQREMTYSSIQQIGKNYVPLIYVPQKTKVTMLKHIKTIISEAQHICLSYKSGERTTPSVLINTTLCPIPDKITIFK